jgi:GrpB-like predicted nucleotidyltransferase (UPF0157 family)
VARKGESAHFLTAFLVKEILADILGHLTGAGGPELASFEKVCGVVRKFHQHFCENVGYELESGEDLEFFFGGYCPARRRVRVARFQVDQSLHRSSFKEVLEGPGESFETLGQPDARDRFKELIDLSLSGQRCRVHFTAFRRLRDTIQGNFSGVGGAIQYGEFGEDGDFHLLGTSMLEMGARGPVEKTYYLGTAIEDIHQALSFDDLVINRTYVSPFVEDLGSYEHHTVHCSDQESVMLDELVTLLPYDPKWPNEFWKESMLLRLCTGHIAGFEHIGSTSVSGLPSVPVIDIMLGIRNVDGGGSFVTATSRLGYVYLGKQGDETVHLYRKRERVSFNLYVVEKGGKFWKSAIGLRTLLRSHPSVASEFGRRKALILNTGGWTLLRYNHEKHNAFLSLVGMLDSNTVKNI